MKDGQKRDNMGNNKAVGASLPDSSEQAIQSQVIDALRFPLAVAVVFLHSGALGEINLTALHANPFALSSLSGFVRIAISGVLAHTAVPLFLLISGYLFFRKLTEWSVGVYKEKLRRRFHTLFIPYIIWITIKIAWAEFVKLRSVILYDEPLEGLWRYLADNGGWHLYYDCMQWPAGNNWLGIEGTMSAPILFPLWFVRDLMIVMICSPLVFWAVKRYKLVPIAVLAVCYITGIFLPIHGVSAGSFMWFGLGAYFAIHGRSMAEGLYKYRKAAYITAIVLVVLATWGGGRLVFEPLGWNFFVLCVISSSVAVFCLFYAAIKRGYMRPSKWFVSSSFFVFCCHLFMLEWSARVCSIVLQNKTIEAFVGEDIILLARYFAQPLLAVAMCLALYWLLGRTMPRLLRALTGGRQAARSGRNGA